MNEQEKKELAVIENFISTANNANEAEMLIEGYFYGDCRPCSKTFDRAIDGIYYRDEINDEIDLAKRYGEDPTPYIKALESKGCEIFENGYNGVNALDTKEKLLNFYKEQYQD